LLSQSITARHVLASVDDLSTSFDESKACARKVIELGEAMGTELSSLNSKIEELTSGWLMRVPTKIMNLASYNADAQLPSPEKVMLRVDEYGNINSRLVKSCIWMITFGDRLRFLKEKQDIHTLFGALLDARDSCCQMQSDIEEWDGVTGFFKKADKIPQVKKVFSSVHDQLPGMLKAMEELKPHLEVIVAKLDVALEIKYP